jgi:hypothetical protein
MDTSFTTVDLKGNKHTVRKCTAEDVFVHFSIVQYLIPNSDQKSYLTVMKDCAKSGIAFCIDNDCFIYAQYSGKQSVNAFSFYGKGKALKTLAMIFYILFNFDKKLMMLKFNLHKGLNVNDFKSLLTDIAIKRQFIPNRPILVRCDTLRNKLLSLYTKRGISWETQ